MERRISTAASPTRRHPVGFPPEQQPRKTEHDASFLIPPFPDGPEQTETIRPRVLKLHGSVTKCSCRGQRALVLMLHDTETNENENENEFTRERVLGLFG